MDDLVAPDLILVNGRVTTLDRAQPRVTAVRDGKFSVVGRDKEVAPLAGSTTRADQRTLNACYLDCRQPLYLIRGGLNFNRELRWVLPWGFTGCSCWAY